LKLKKTETGSNQPIQTGLAWFFWFGLISIFFCFFGFRLKKPKPNRLVFLKFNRFFKLFFSGLIGFLLTPGYNLDMIEFFFLSLLIQIVGMGC
jgi:hypothetical protein